MSKIIGTEHDANIDGQDVGDDDDEDELDGNKWGEDDDVKDGNKWGECRGRPPPPKEG